MLRGVFQGEEEKSTKNGCPRVHRVSSVFALFLKIVIRDELMAGRRAVSEFLGSSHCVGAILQFKCHSSSTTALWNISYQSVGTSAGPKTIPKSRKTHNG